MMKKKNLPIGLWQYHYRNKGVKKKNLGNCDNPIVENGKEKNKKSSFRNSINVEVAFVLFVFLFH